MIKKIDNYDITNQIQNYFLTSVDDFCGIQFKSFWLPQFPVTGEQVCSSSKKT